MRGAVVFFFFCIEPPNHRMPTIMKNLVFRIYLMVTLCWQSSIAERSANGYFYDKPEGTLFDESRGTGQSTSVAAIFPPAPTGVAYFQELLPPLPTSPQAVTSASLEIVPAKLVYEDRQPGLNFGLQSVQNFEGNFAPQQPIYRGANLQPIAFNIQDGSQAYNSIQQPCGPEPIVAQYNPHLVDLLNGGPVTRIITTCGPNNDCKSINLQSDPSQRLGVQSQANFGGNIQQSFQSYEAQPRTSNVGIYAVESPLVRPPGRRLIPYTEIERDDI